jgi:hypothetical protein
MPMQLPSNITETMWWQMCNNNMSQPVMLKNADITKPFVYDRRWGVFYTPFGHHQGAMRLLLTWQQGCRNENEMCERLNIRYDRAADYWLQHTPGSAFLSGAPGGKIQVWSFKNLTAGELRLLDNVVEIGGSGHITSSARYSSPPF